MKKTGYFLTILFLVAFFSGCSAKFKHIYQIETEQEIIPLFTENGTFDLKQLLKLQEIIQLWNETEHKEDRFSRTIRVYEIKPDQIDKKIGNIIEENDGIRFSKDAEKLFFDKVEFSEYWKELFQIWRSAGTYPIIIIERQVLIPDVLED